MSFEKNSVVQDHKLKHKKLVFEYEITGNATPASKKHASDLPGVCLIATEGKLTDVTDVEAISGLTGYTAPVDNNAGASVHVFMLKGDELGSIKKVMKVSVTDKDAIGGTITVTKLGDDYGLTSGGNIAVEVAGATLALDTESPTFVVEIDYLLSE